jgi:hypothetical protein
VSNAKFRNGVRQELTSHRPALEQDERDVREDLREHQPRDSTATTKVDHASLIGEMINESLCETQRVQQMLFERRRTYRSDALRVNKALDQRRRQVPERETVGRRVVTRQWRVPPQRRQRSVESQRNAEALHLQTS